MVESSSVVSSQDVKPTDSSFNFGASMPTLDYQLSRWGLLEAWWKKVLKKTGRICKTLAMTVA